MDDIVRSAIDNVIDNIPNIVNSVFENEKNKFSLRILETFKEVLDDDMGYAYIYDKNKNIIRYEISYSDVIGYQSAFYIEVYGNEFSITADMPIGCRGGNSPDPAVVEFLCRANYGMTHGYFDLEPKAGQIKYRIKYKCDDAPPTAEDIRIYLDTASSMISRYFPGLFDVLFRHSDPKKAVEKCESD